MRWYECYYGTWKEPHGVIRVCSDYNKKKVFDAAQKTANETGRIVTVSEERPTVRGMALEFYKVFPAQG